MLFATENGNLVACAFFVPTNESNLERKRMCEVADSALQQRQPDAVVKISRC
jgi:hypothetical protein